MKKIVSMIFIAVMLCNTLGTTNYETIKAANVTENGMDTASGSAINTTELPATESPEEHDEYDDYYNNSHIIQMGDFILRKGNCYDYDGREEILYIYQYLGNSSNVIIPDEYEGEKIEGIMSEAFSNNTKVEEIQFPKSLKIIEKDAFSGCTNLIKVELPNTVKFIGVSAFEGCKKLSEVQLPDALDTIDYSSFDGTGVKEFTIDSKNPSFTTVDGVIYNKGCTELILVPCQKSELELPDTVTKISSCAAFGNTKLTKVKFSNKLITIGESAFTSCSKLKEVQFPNTIKEIEEYAFASCYELKDIFIPASVTSLEETAFVNCKNIKTFKIDKNNKKYCSIDGEFYNKKKTIFYGVVTNKKSLTLPKSVKTMGFGKAVYGQNLQKIKVQKGNKYFSVYDNVLYDKKQTEIFFCPGRKKSIILPATFKKGTTLLACGQNLQKIKVQKGNKYFSAYDNVLYDKKQTGIYFCPSSKKSIILPATFTKDDTLYERALIGCLENLEKIQVKAGNKSFSSYKGVLYNKKKTKIIYVPEKIKSITIPKTCVSNISLEVRESIANNPYVTSIAVEKGNKKFQAQDGILYNKKQTEVLLCTKGKEKVVLPQMVKSIGIRAFSGCKKLKSIIFSNNLEEIQAGAFEYCNSLEYVKLPDRKIEIDAMAFMQCANLKWIYIPKEARFTEEQPRHIFGGSNKLSDIYYSGSEEEWKKSWSRYGRYFPYDEDIDITEYAFDFDEKVFGWLKVHYQGNAPL